MASVAEISTQPTNDPNVRVYHTRFEMSSGPEVGGRGSVDELGEFGRLLLKISGISQVRLCPYILLVTKAPLFDWSEVEPKVEELLKMFAASQRLIEDAHKASTTAGVKGLRTIAPRAARRGGKISEPLLDVEDPR